MGKKIIIIGILGLLIGCSNREVVKEEQEEISISHSVQGDVISFYSKYRYPKDIFYKAEPVAYLQSINENKNKNGYFNKIDEREFLNFYKDLNVRGYGDNSNYWRWKFSITEKELENILNKNLVSVGKRRTKDVLTLVDEKWVFRPIPDNPVGNFKEIRVMERGKSGIIIKIMVRGSKGTYLVAREGNIRNLLGLSNTDIAIYGSKGESSEYIAKPIATRPSMLPSGYFAFERMGERYNFYGGGYGHGVGMPQWAVADLTKNYGYSYSSILKRYYKNMKLENIENLTHGKDEIRVGIMNTGFKTLDHESIRISSSSPLKIQSKNINIKTKGGEKIDFVNKHGAINISINGKVKGKTSSPLKITSEKNKISVESIKRGLRKAKYPSYRGIFEIKLSSSPNKLRLINEVDIEEYLMQVVPSEMPESFGLEALKVQAVAARTYALSDYLKGRYKAQGFHVTDSTQSQVYNNSDENRTSIEAIEATRGEVMIHGGKPIDAKYYSTSSGYGAAAHNVW